MKDRRNHQKALSKVHNSGLQRIPKPTSPAVASRLIIHQLQVPQLQLDSTRIVRLINKCDKWNIIVSALKYKSALLLSQFCIEFCVISGTSWVSYRHRKTLNLYIAYVPITTSCQLFPQTDQPWTFRNNKIN